MNVKKSCKLLLYLIIMLCLSLRGWSQQIGIPTEKKPIREVLEYIEKTTAYRFLYTEDPMFNKMAGAYDGKATDISVALTAILKDTDISFRINANKLITLHTPRSALLATKDSAGAAITLSGTITDLQNQPLNAVTIYLKANPLVGTVSDKNGYFVLGNISRYATLVISSVGYRTQEVEVKTIPYASLRKFPVIMESESLTKDEVVVTAMGTQKKVSVVGAITTINPSELKAPTRSLTSQLAGRVAGVTFVQSSGQPGQDGASFIIRGINSVSGSTSPLILIDGLRRNIDDVDPNDIATFSVLKDASATAVYGLEGSNGIIVITTKTGKIASKPTVRISASHSVNNATYKPTWVDAPTFAKMKNEALVVRDKRPMYTDQEIAKFADNDMDFYPNVDWYKTMIRQNNPATKANFNISGGGNAVTYYMSGGLYNEKGMFNSKSASNANYNQFNFRSNLKADLTPITTLGIGFDGRYNTTTEPGQGAGALLDIMNNVNPTLFPAEFSDGSAPEEPTGIVNPYSLLTKTGFVKNYANYMSTNLNLIQKLDFLTEGLFLSGIASFTKSNYYAHRYYKDYQRHAIDYMNSYLGTGRDKDGNLVTINKTPDINDKMGFYYTAPTGDRVVELQGSLNYAHTFFKKLAVTGLMLYKQREYLTDAPSGDGGTLLINALPTREQSVAGRITFGWANRYFTDINFGASGSQMFTPDKRWSSFPSVGFAWVPSAEKFWNGGIADVIDFLKFRVSYGVVGASGSASRFGYMATTSGRTGYSFGFGQAAGSGIYVPGVGESRLEQLNLTWERNQKLNLGTEIGLFRDMKLIVDAYQYVNSDQLISLSRLPATLGLPSIPQANLGKTESKGIDFDLTYTKSFGNFKINYIKAIVSYNKNKIIENGQLDPKVAYQSGIGLDWGRDLNYIALGLFKDQKDIDNSPVQTWNKVMPGDIKYKDIDGDGVITANDRIWTGNRYPKWSYSLAIDLRYKKWTFATRAIGKLNQFRTIYGNRIPFNPYNAGGNENGAIYAAAVKDHWTPASYSGNPATENPNATYPRLAYGSDNLNNAQISTFWLREASYLRIADAELGYTWTPRSKKSPFKSIYYYGRCDNVYTFSKFKDWNPEQTSSYAYPLKRTISLGLEIGFDL